MLNVQFNVSSWILWIKVFSLIKLLFGTLSNKKTLSCRVLYETFISSPKRDYSRV